MPAAPLYRPRMLAELTVPIMGTRAQRIRQEASDETVNLAAPVRSGRYESNDFNHADELEIDLDWREAGIDPRMLDDGTVSFFLGNADAFGAWEPTVDNCRFIGTVRGIETKHEGDHSPSVRIRARDFTGLFLDAKPFGSSGIPDLGMTLDEAWRLIVSQTPGADVLAARLYRSPDITSWPKLSDAVPSRFSKIAKVQTHPETDAWAVWQQCVGMLGLISWIDRDRCIVSTATDYYTAKNPPRLVYGRNVKSLTQSREACFGGKGIGITSFDPTTNKTIEAIYPPVDDKRLKRKRTKAKKIRHDGGAIPDADKREWFSVPELGTQEAADKVAQRVYEERSRQELSGTARTSEMLIDTVSREHFDTLTLKAGDAIRIEFDQSDQRFIANLPNTIARYKALVLRGYSPDIAELIAKNMDQIAALDPTFYVRSVTTELAISEHEITFDVDVNFVNRIQITGDTA